MDCRTFSNTNGFHKPYLTAKVITLAEAFPCNWKVGIQDITKDAYPFSAQFKS